MPKTALTEARIRNLKPRKSTYEVRDTILPGFGVRVLPSGTRSFFIHAQVQGERIWKNLGDANSITLESARDQAAILLEEIRRSANTALFEAVAEAVFRRHARVWKAGTLRVNRGYLNRQILPAFSGRDISEITQTDVRQWFASHRATPVAADRSMPVLSVIFREAEHMGLRPEGSNPCRGIRRYRRKGRGEIPLERGTPQARGYPLGKGEGKAAGGRGRPPPAVDRMPAQGDSDPAPVGLPGRPSVPSRQQDRAEDRVAVTGRPGGARGHSRIRGPVVSGPGRQPDEKPFLAHMLLA